MTRGTDDVAPFVHRRPNPRAHHPLLVWHLGIWNPIALGAIDLDEPEELAGAAHPEAMGPDKPKGLVAIAMEAREARAAAYTAQLLERIRRQLRAKGEAAEKSFHSSHETLTMAAPVSGRFDMHGFRAQIRVDLDLEYITITVLLDMAPRAGKVELDQKCDPRVRKVIDQLNKFRDLIDKSLKHDAAHLSGASPLSRSKLKPLANACFNDIWDFIGKEILGTETDAFKALGEKRFADFRSLYLGDEVKKGGSRSKSDEAVEVLEEEEVKLPAKQIYIPGFFQTPFWRARREKSRRDHKDPIESKNWRGRFHVLWPLMTAPVKGADIVNHEFTATIIEGSAIHLTGMGARPDNAPGNKPYPLYYGVYTVGMGGWAIGRLVSQLCELGTLRMAASQDIERLEKATAPLREAEIVVQRAFDLELRGPESTRRDSTKPLQDALEKIHERKKDADKLVPGGIAYRAERSAYYIKRFEGVLGSLKMSAYDDLQPYDKYVYAHHGAAFSYIESLGTRYARLMHDMRSLYQRMVAEEGRNRYYEIVKIQNFAEALSIGVLAPYYIGTIMAHVLWGEPDKMSKWWWGTVFMALIGAASSRMRAEKLPFRLLRSVTFVIGVTGAALLLFTAVHLRDTPEAATLPSNMWPVVAAFVLATVTQLKPDLLALIPRLSATQWPKYLRVCLAIPAAGAAFLTALYSFHAELEPLSPVSEYWWLATGAFMASAAMAHPWFNNRLVAALLFGAVGIGATIKAAIETWPYLIPPF